MTPSHFGLVAAVLSLAACSQSSPEQSEGTTTARVVDEPPEEPPPQPPPGITVAEEQGELVLVHRRLGLTFIHPGATYRQTAESQRNLCGTEPIDDSAGCIGLIDPGGGSAYVLNLGLVSASDVAALETFHQGILEAARRDMRVLEARLLIEGRTRPESRIWALSPQGEGSINYFQTYIVQTPHSEQPVAVHATYVCTDVSELPALPSEPQGGAPGQ